MVAGCRPQGPAPAGRQVIATAQAPAAIGPYSQGIKVGNMLFTSGQIAIDPATGQLLTGSIEEQTRRVLDNLGAVLKAAGMDFGDVVSATVYMDDIANYPGINAVYAEYFPKDPPARCAMQVARLPKGAAVEIALVAIKD
ncbi:MAG: RidA family protein [bacterium]|nr:RidA family protein [candidate division KSB1 bacterium]MDH7560532.1 RidA family protein [bacterium]